MVDMAIAQNEKISVAVHGGINISNITIDGYTGFKNRTGVCAGLGFGYKPAKNILLLVEANYDEKGYRNQYSVTDNTGFELGKTYVKYYSTYLSFPIIINYISKGVNTFEAGIGINNNFLLSANIITPSEPIYGFPPNSEINHKDIYKSYELAYTMRTGGSIKIASRLNLLLEGRYSKGLTSFGKSEAAKFIHTAFFFGTGVRYYFNESEK